MKREIKFKSYIRTKSTGEIKQYIWIPFPIDRSKDDPCLSDDEEIIEYGLQFTGLTDKNGKEIYHKDIVANGISTYTVVWSANAWKIQRGAVLHYIANEIIDLKVIGNIYENEDLIK